MTIIFFENCSALLLIAFAAPSHKLFACCSSPINKLESTHFMFIHIHFDLLLNSLTIQLLFKSDLNIARKCQGY